MGVDPMLFESPVKVGGEVPAGTYDTALFPATCLRQQQSSFKFYPGILHKRPKKYITVFRERGGNHDLPCTPLIRITTSVVGRRVFPQLCFWSLGSGPNMGRDALKEFPKVAAPFDA